MPTATDRRTPRDSHGGIDDIDLQLAPKPRNRGNATVLPEQNTRPKRTLIVEVMTEAGLFSRFEAPIGPAVSPCSR
ncbi:MAG: hypothetical protein PVH50_06770 [Anaerolineae bacterium]